MKDMHVFHPKYTPNSKLLLIGGDGSLHRHQLHRQHLSTPIHITPTPKNIPLYRQCFKLNLPIKAIPIIPTVSKVYL